MAANEVRVSGAMTFATVMNRVKPVLASQEVVEIHAMGRAVNALSIAIERLVSLNYAVLERINTEMVTDQGRAVKMTAVLKKSPGFDQAEEAFIASRGDKTTTEAEVWT